MRNWKRLFYYLFINVLVSACVTVAVLTIWDRVRAPEAVVPPSGAQSSENLAPEVDEGTISAIALATQSAGAAAVAAEPTALEENPEEPTRKKIEYAVQSGDTLGRIADRFDITIEDILAENELEDPNRLEIGQILIIPGQAEPDPAEPRDLPEETEPPPAATGESPAAGGEGEVTIDSVIGAGDLNSERVLLKRTGAGEISMQGWQLLEEDGQVFTFPKLTLFEDGAVYVHTRAGQPTVVDLHWGLDAPVWETGETVVLLDNRGQVRATYRVP